MDRNDRDMLILDHVNCIYDGDTKLPVHALEDICLTIRSGEFAALIGHTGSGKSTLVQHLNGLLRPTSGNIYFAGKDIWDPEYSRKELRARVGLVFQYPEHQLFEATVFEDVCFGPKNIGFSKKEAELKAYEALRLTGLPEELYFQSPFTLSGGQKRRAAIAGVLAMQPALLILDEPTAGLDPRGRDDILSMVDRMQKEKGISVLLVSHSMEDVARYAERIIVMDKGRIVYDDKPSVVFGHVEELERMGLAAPQVVYIMRSLQKAGLNVRTDLTNVAEAKEEILKALGITVSGERKMHA